MTDQQLIKRARRAGITTEYRDWQGRRVAVPAQTLATILDELEQPSRGPAAGAASDTSPSRTQGPRLDPPATRQWGFTVQLYSLRSASSWGHGDLHDLAELARWSATELGAGFVLVNPLHAAEPLTPVSNSPYLPMTRLFTSPLYLRVEDVPEYGALQPEGRRQIAALARPLRAANTTCELIDRDAVWRAKRRALELIHGMPLTSDRSAAFGRFRDERGRDLRNWSLWCALAERHGPDWREWPAELADPDRAERRAGRDPEIQQAAEFHAWLQWHLDEQLAAAQNAAKSAGMAHGIIHDLAVGVHPGGADAWAHQHELVAGCTVGAPPDGFNQLGQDWAQPPWHPGRLAATGYRPLAELFSASLRHAGGIRVDHVMGLMRLWWVPAGQAPDRGAYVSYDHVASVAALTSAAAHADAAESRGDDPRGSAVALRGDDPSGSAVSSREDDAPGAPAVAIGEDLGTVEPWIRDYLHSRGVLGTEMLWFAYDRDGHPLAPGRWRRTCMATVGTHDVPTIAGFVTGEQVSVRARLGLLRRPESAERARSEQMLARWHAALVANRLLPAGRAPDTAQFTVALYGYLRKTPALLLGVSLADAVGELRTQNIPGTSDEYPNWRIPLCDDHGRAVLLEDLPGSKLLLNVCQAVRPG